jgi:dihydrolipoamide dehydrogenase
MAVIDIKVPDIGDFDEVGVIEVLVKVGDTIRASGGHRESDKASMEIPSSRWAVRELKVDRRQGCRGQRAAVAGSGR